MNPQPDPRTPPAGDLQQQVRAGVQSHRIKLRVLSSAAFLLGLLALVAAFLIAWCYPIYILPKQKELKWRARDLLEYVGTNSPATTVNHEESTRRVAKLLTEQIVVVNDLTRAAIVGVAITVGLLALGTLNLLTVVILNRRAALNQVNASLARISDQLLELQKTQGSA